MTVKLVAVDRGQGFTEVLRLVLRKNLERDRRYKARCQVLFSPLGLAHVRRIGWCEIAGWPPQLELAVESALAVGSAVVTL